MADSHSINITHTNTIDVVVCYATSQNIIMLDINLKQDSTIQDAIEHSQILNKCREIDIVQCKVGVFGKVRVLNTILHQGDRVEIYRPLNADPMEARRRRAVKKPKT
ncbi:MAG: RnfH family protein [Undibacterium sp.]|nr:RnfH family protein [Undibacterium sp.]